MSQIYHAECLTVLLLFHFIELLRWWLEHV